MSTQGRFLNRRGFSLKRRLLPSTLYESGRHAVRAAGPLLADLQLNSSDTVLLHTTYLAPLIPAVRDTGARAAVDVYDLVLAGNRIDATDASLGAWAMRTAYAAAVRAREMRLLSSADRLIVAGYRDFEAATGSCPSRFLGSNGARMRAYAGTHDAPGASRSYRQLCP